MTLPAAWMRLFVGLAMCGAGLSAAYASLNPIHISGKPYVPLSEWARANGFSARWIQSGQTLQLGKDSSTVVFENDSKEARVNGTAIWLCLPVAVRGGELFLAQMDVQTTLQPLVSPPKNRSGAQMKSICIDPGHGGNDPGFHIGSNQEKKFTLLLAQELRQQLTHAGLTVSLTRSSDTALELEARPDLARRRMADLFVSLHFNSAESSQNTVHGAEVYCLTPAGASSTNARGQMAGAGFFPGNRFDAKNMLLAYQLQKSLTRTLSAEDRGVRRARFAVLREATMPAVLIEAGFMSHPVEGRKIQDAAYRRSMAHAIAEGLLAYKQIVERQS